MKARCASVSGVCGTIALLAIARHLRCNSASAASGVKPASTSRQPATVPVRPMPARQCR